MKTKTLLIVLALTLTALAETKVEVFSSHLVTEKNKNGRGIIDIDTPEGAEIFGGAEAVARYKTDLAAVQTDKDRIAQLEALVADLLARIKKLEEK